MPRTWVEIDTEALAWNCRLVQNKIGDASQLLAVIKANAYGHGAAIVARTLHDLGLRWFGVASVEEGKALRAMLPDANIVVLGWIPPEELHGIFESELIPQISDMRFATALDAQAQRQDRVQPVHVKIDTGMGRLGVFPRESENFLGALSRLSHLRVEGILSHLSSADEENLEPSQSQQKIFDEVLRQSQAAGLPVQWFHLANSHAIFRMPHAHYNMVRCGLFLYGLYPTNDYSFDFSLRPVLSWKSQVGLIKEYQPGQTVSYGRTHRVERPTKIAVIPVGYADGYNRRLSNKGLVLVRGAFARVLGRVTMDHIMADISAIPGVQEGDEVVLLGRQGDNRISAEDLAQSLDTISYEIVCAIGPRVSRIPAKQEIALKNSL